MGSLLPTSNPLSSSNSPSPSFSSSSTNPPIRGYNSSPSSGSNFIRSPSVLTWSKIRKMAKFGRMDFELAFWNLTYLCVAPRRVYRNVYYHKQTKNQWARDDPAMVVLISGCLVLAAIAWSVIHGYTLLQTLNTALLMVFRDFLLSSAAVATVQWFMTNHLLRSPKAHFSPSDTKVEWAFAFDVAVNAFFTFFLWIYVGQLLLVSLITKENWVCLWLGNSVWLAALSQYIYISYLGFAALPFLVRSELLLAPLLPVFVGYVLSLLGFNMAKTVLEAYFGQTWHS
ncbi:Uncharacterized conserved protein [Phaffia rhodozyma]|uniref:Uncharacterized conserved protein n=1 Tax=Phaffia rhodozyma TaxID=264483 RepID=A0A0F7SX40_PHARH|nr:Uncharacterized conserved protein [Phaffia rhodozyma]